MTALPGFPAASERLREFLVAQGVIGGLAWVFREDLCSGPKEVLIRDTQRSENEQIAAFVYEKGRSQGQVELVALAVGGGRVAVTAWIPEAGSAAIQGWNGGLKLSIRSPLPKARWLPAWQWAIVRHMPSYRRYQKYEHFVATKRRAAA